MPAVLLLILLGGAYIASRKTTGTFTSGSHGNVVFQRFLGPPTKLPQPHEALPPWTPPSVILQWLGIGSGTGTFTLLPKKSTSGVPESPIAVVGHGGTSSGTSGSTPLGPGAGGAGGAGGAIGGGGRGRAIL